MFDINERRD